MNIIVKFKNMLIETLKENKKLIIGLYILFIITFIAAWILSGDKVASAVGNLPASTTPNNMVAESPLDIFLHNEWGGIITYVTSIFFGISALLILVYNGVNLGTLGQLFNTIMPNGGLKYLMYLIPHGIFEITATVFQSVAGILLFLFIWRFVKALKSSGTDGFSDSFEKTKKPLIQSIILMIFSTILLIIAAPIEAYFSVPFSTFVPGF